VPRNFGMSPSSRIERGKTWPAPAGATRVKKFERESARLDATERHRHRQAEQIEIAFDFQHSR
jgi:hypothetical protein